MGYLSQVKINTDWQEAANAINANFTSLNTAVEKARSQTMVKLPLCDTLEILKENHPPAYEDQMGLVGTTLPATLYKVKNGAWTSTGQSVGDPSVVLTGSPAFENLGKVDEVNV